MDVRVESRYDPQLADTVTQVWVQLSEHNLRDLVAQFADDHFVGQSPYADLHRRIENTTLHVEVVDDEKHYGTRTPGMGSGLVDR